MFSHPLQLPALFYEVKPLKMLAKKGSNFYQCSLFIFNQVFTGFNPLRKHMDDAVKSFSTVVIIFTLVGFRLRQLYCESNQLSHISKTVQI